MTTPARRFSDRVYIVTGSTQRLGEGISHELAREGARGLVVTGRHEAGGRAVCEGLEAAGAEALFVPAGGDAYILSHIIHDWTEDQCLTILGHVRRALRPGGRVLIVETVVPAGDAPQQGKLQDMVMLAIPGGQERTEDEYRKLLSKAGFRLTRVAPTTSVVSIVEALPS